jgi:hypothetical protein
MRYTILFAVAFALATNTARAMNSFYYECGDDTEVALAIAKDTGKVLGTSPTLAELLTRRALVTFLTCWTNRADQRPRSIVSLVDLVSAGLASAHPSAWSPMAR